MDPFSPSNTDHAIERDAGLLKQSHRFIAPDQRCTGLRHYPFGSPQMVKSENVRRRSSRTCRCRPPGGRCLPRRALDRCRRQETASVPPSEAGTSSIRTNQGLRSWTLRFTLFDRRISSRPLQRRGPHSGVRHRRLEPQPLDHDAPSPSSPVHGPTRAGSIPGR